MDLPPPSPYPIAVLQTVFDARPEIARPGAFLRRGWCELRVVPRLAGKLFRSNLRAARRRSLFGYLWLLLPAATTALVSVYLQRRQIVTVGMTPLPYALHVLAGMVMWQAFLDALNAPVQQLGAARPLITRTMLPHEAVLLAGLCEVSLHSAIRFVALAVFVAAIGLVPAAGALAMIPLGTLLLIVLGTGLGLALAPLALLYDDVRRGIGVATTLWFFLTPVLYVAPQTGWLRYNPVTPLLDTARGALMEPALPTGFVVTGIASLVLLLFAWLGYRLARPHVIERLG